MYVNKEIMMTESKKELLENFILVFVYFNENSIYITFWNIIRFGGTI